MIRCFVLSAHSKILISKQKICQKEKILIFQRNIKQQKLKFLVLKRSYTFLVVRVSTSILAKNLIDLSAPQR